jgi:PGF-CTERM protein
MGQLDMYGTEFNGTFDGEGYKIMNLTIGREVSGADWVGLFVSIGSAGEVTNVSVVNADIYADTIVGVIAGFNKGMINRSYVSGSINGRSRVGGLIGDNRGMVIKSYASVSVNGTDDPVGGLIGTNSGTISESYVTGSVISDHPVGGVAGFTTGGTVNESYWNAETKTPSGYRRLASISGGTELATSEMTGSAARDNMKGFDFTNTWKTVPDGYPIFKWQNESITESRIINDNLMNNRDGNESNDRRNRSTGGEGLPGFTVVTALLALLTVVAVAVRRRKE